MSDQNWRTDVDAGDYFLHQKKQLSVADRRPVIRRSSDLVGPGIGATTVRLDDFNDLLATFNGYYSSEAGAANAPTADEVFVGYVVSDAEFGGQQAFTGLDTGIEYVRRFVRSPIDPEALAWGAWTSRVRVISAVQGYAEHDTNVLSSTPAMLTPPTLTSNDGGETFEVEGSSIKILRQGVYTGSIQIGDRVGSTTLTNLSIYRPNGSATEGYAQLNVPLGPTVHIPFTVWANDGAQGFSIVVTHAAGAPRDLWWRFSATRVGDAL